MKKQKKAQALTTDFIIGLMMFIFLLITSITIIINITPDQTYEILYTNNLYISESLITPGFPQNWNETNVAIPGITTNQRLNLTKLNKFDNIPYETSKTLLLTENEYIIFFENSSGIINITKCVRGYNIQTDENCKPLLNTTNIKNLVKTERYLIYNSQIIQMNIYSWN